MSAPCWHRDPSACKCDLRAELIAVMAERDAILDVKRQNIRQLTERGDCSVEARMHLAEAKLAVALSNKRVRTAMARLFAARLHSSLAKTVSTKTPNKHKQAAFA